MEINFEPYLSKIGALTRSFKQSPEFEYLREMFPWCEPKGKYLKICYERNIVSQPTCAVCGQSLPNPCKQVCNMSCQLKLRVERSIVANTGKAPYNKGKSMDELGIQHVKFKNPERWHTAKKKISLANSGLNNGMFGRVWTDEELHRQRTTILETIASGKYTPKSNNRLTHFDSYCDGIKFRSSWEAAFYCIMSPVEFESVRVRYFDSTKQKERIYIVDFVDREKKILYEIRPSELFSPTSDKSVAAIKWCKENCYEFVHIGLEMLYNSKHMITDRVDSNSHRKLNDAFKKYERNLKARCSI